MEQANTNTLYKEPTTFEEYAEELSNALGGICPDDAYLRKLWKMKYRVDDAIRDCEAKFDAQMFGGGY